MIILDEPYVSDLLIKTCRNDGFDVLENEMTNALKISNITTDDAVKKYGCQKYPSVYTNSENSINWIIKNLSDTTLPGKINLFKDKVRFRKLLQKVYPDFFFKEVDFEELKILNVNELKFPFVIKPSVGFLSMGVYIVKGLSDWEKTVQNLEIDMEKFKGKFPKEVMDSKKFIVEEYIEGEEYAIDAYFNNEGEPVILNIYRHHFEGGDDVKDRVYYTSKDIINENLNDFTKLLKTIGGHVELKNFPMHIEVRRNEKSTVPIEVNPLRFAGWCTCDLAKYAYGIDVYEYYIKSLKPHWESIVTDNCLHYFLMAEVPSQFNVNEIKNFDYEKFLKNISMSYEIRRYDYKTKPLFAVVLGKAKDESEINNFLSLSMLDFVSVAKSAK